MMSDDWIAGLIAGEGSFTVAFTPKADRKCNIQAVPTFQLAMSIEWKEVIENIQKRIGVGRIRIEKRSQKNPKYNDMVVLVVQSYNDAKRLIEFLDDKYLGAKEHDFVIWKKIIKIFDEKKHTTPEGIYEMYQLREQMYNKPRYRKHTLDDLKSFVSGRGIEHITMSVRLPKAMLQRLNKIVREKNYTNLSEAVRDAIREFLEEKKEIGDA